MDTRTLVAFGMLLGVLTVALFKGSITGTEAKEVLMNIASGLLGGAIGYQLRSIKPPPPPPTGHTPPHGTPKVG